MADTSRRDLLQTFIDRANASDWDAIETQRPVRQPRCAAGLAIHLRCSWLLEASPAGSIFSVDRDASALQVQLRALVDAFPHVRAATLVADFSRPLEFPGLDGIVMANSLHFERDKLAVLGLI